MRFFTTRYESMDAAQGVVIVDELGAHLHPAWQMRSSRRSGRPSHACSSSRRHTTRSACAA